jgi:hypothetical protein
MTSPRPTRRSSRLRILEGENYTVENVQNQPTTEASQEGQSPLRLPSLRRARYTHTWDQASQASIKPSLDLLANLRLLSLACAYLIS